MVKRFWNEVRGWWLPWRNSCSELDYSTHHLKPGVGTYIWNPSSGVVETRIIQSSLASLSGQDWALSSETDRVSKHIVEGDIGRHLARMSEFWILRYTHTVIQKGKEACNIECVVSYFEIANFNLMISKAEMRTGERKRSAENEKDSGPPKRRYYLKCRTMTAESSQWGRRGEQVFSLVKYVWLW